MHKIKNNLRKSINNYKKIVKKKRSTYLDSFIFIHINKTGGSSIEKALNLPFEHKTALQKINEIGEKRFKAKFSFAVIRNPFDRLVSQYFYRLQKNQALPPEKKKPLGIKPIEFKEWVRETHVEYNSFYRHNPSMFQPQYVWITNKDGEVVIDFICRFENLSHEIDQVSKIIGRDINLPHLKKSKRKDYREYYDSETIEIVNSYYEKDLEMFGYQFE